MDFPFMASILVFACLVTFGFVSEAVDLDIDAVEKPLTFLILLAIGRLLQSTKNTVTHVIGFQQIILSALLPALLYKSITNLSIEEFKATWQFSVVSLIYSFYLVLIFQISLYITGFTVISKEMSTLAMMFPGLAPGLTSLPYVDAIVSDMAPYTINAGHVGLADLGVKVFVLFICYIVSIAMSNSAQKRNEAVLDEALNRTRPGGLQQVCGTIYSLLIGFFAEPVIVAVILATALLVAGPVTLEKQSLWGKAVLKLAGCCSASIFILIGVKMKLEVVKQLGLLFLMVMRSGAALLFVALYSRICDVASNEIMFWVYFSNAALSFWPYTHIVKCSDAEERSYKLNCQAAFNEASGSTFLDDDARQWFDEQSSNIEKGNAFVRELLEIAMCKLDDFKETAGEQPEDKINRLRHIIATLQASECTFDLPVALMSLTVSFSWTVLFCSTVSLTPVEFWTEPMTCPIVGGVLTLIGLVFLACHGRRSRSYEINESNVTTSRAQGTIVYDATVDELTLEEADQELKRQCDRETFFRPSIAAQGSALRAHAKRSVRFSCSPSQSVGEDSIANSCTSSWPQSIANSCATSGRMSKPWMPDEGFVVASEKVSSQLQHLSKLPVMLGGVAGRRDKGKE